MASLIDSDYLVAYIAIETALDRFETLLFEVGCRCHEYNTEEGEHLARCNRGEDRIFLDMAKHGLGEIEKALDETLTVKP